MSTKNAKRPHKPSYDTSSGLESLNLSWFRTTLLYLLAAFVLLAPWLSIGSVEDIHTRLFFWLVNFSFFFTLAVVIGIFGRLLRAPRGRYLAVVGTLVVAKTVSLLFSISPFRSVWGGYQVWSDGVLYLVAIVALGYGVLALEPSRQEVKRFLHLIFAQALVLAAATLVDGWNQGVTKHIVRPSSPLQNSDYFLSYGFLVWPLLLMVLIVSFKLRQKWYRRAAYGMALVILSLAMFITLPVGIQAVVLRMPIGTQTSTKLSTAAQQFLANPSNNERWAEWDVGTKIGLKYPVLGSGPGTTQLAFFGLQKTGYRFPGDETGMTVEHPHNDLIEQFSQAGAIGLIAYLAVWIGLIVLYARRRKALDPAVRPYAAGLFWGLMLFLAFNTMLFTTVFTGIVAAVWIALLVGLLRAASLHEYDEIKAPYWIAIVLSLLLFGTGTVYAWSYQVAEQNSRLANLAYTTNHPRYAITYSLNAVEGFKHEPLYNWQAGLYGAFALAQRSPEIMATELEPISQQSVFFSDEAVKRDPYTTRYLLNQGLVRYLLAKPGSEEEKDGKARIKEAESRAPMVYTIYLQAANFFVVKGDYALAEEQFAAALKCVPAKDKKKVEKAIADYHAYKNAPKRVQLQ